MPTPTIVTRASKGSALTYDELDANFTNLRDATGSGGTLTSDTTVITVSSAGTTTLTFTHQIVYINVTATSGTVTLDVSDARNHSLQPLIIIVYKASAGANLGFNYTHSGDHGLGLTNAIYDYEVGSIFFDIIHNPLFDNSASSYAPISIHRRNSETQNWPRTTTPSYINNVTSTDLAAITGTFGAIAVETNSGVGTLKYWNGSAWVSGTYSLPTATTSVLGGVKIDGSTITISGGVISAATPTINANNLSGTTLKSTVVTSSLTSVGTLTSLTTSGTASITYEPGSATGQAISVTAKNTVGGTSYADFLKVTNSASGASNINKTLRLNSTGGLEIINSAYTATLLTIADNAIITIPGPASTTSNSATNNALAIGTHGQIFDDGNLHIHTSGGSLWLNSLTGGDIQLGIQSNSGSSNVKANGTFYMNSGYGSVAPVYGVRAWISCGWNGSSMVTNGSGNLSVSRDSTGIYIFTFGTAMPDGNYAINATARVPGNNSDVAVNIHYNTATSAYTFTLATARYGTGFEDVPQLTVSVVR